MNMAKTGSLISKLRRENKLTQKELAEKLGICAKTVSKWETGRGFPDISLISNLSEVFKVDISKLLEGEMPNIKPEVGNMRKIKLYVCEKCGNILSAFATTDIVCCGRKLSPLIPKEADETHKINIEKIEDDHYITFSHPMSKEHFISFFSFIRYDRMLTIKLYPEQGGEVRIPEMRAGKLYYYCNQHGLFEIKL